MKKKTNLKNQIANSLKQEETATKDRFAKADAAFATKEKPKTEPKTRKPKAPPKKPEKVVRQIFSMPKNDVELIETLRKKCMQSGFAPNQSEVVRGGLQLLGTLKPKELATVLQGVEKMKQGRPT